MTAANLRAPVDDEYEHVVRRHGELYAEEYGWDDTFRHLVAGIVGDFRAAHDPARERMWVADVEGAIAGAVLAVRAPDGPPDIAQLRCLYVEPRFRGRGIGRALVDACVAFCRTAGHARVRLWTMDVLTDAARLYAAAGFRRIEAIPGRHFGHNLVAEVWEL